MEYINKLFSDIITADTGFAPNPFWGVCSLACCKPKIRKTAEVGDWIVGIRGKTLYSRKANKNSDNIYKIIYVFKVTGKLSFEEYFYSRKYESKKTNFEKREAIYKCGDNIYEPLVDGNFRQLRSFHSKDFESATWEEDTIKKQTDLSGKFVLISNKFYYFGGEPIEIPAKLESIIPGRGHKCHFGPKILESFSLYVRELRGKRGVNSAPTSWPKEDYSGKTQ